MNTYIGRKADSASGKRGVKMERESRKNPHCLRRSRVVRILGFRANILAELSEALIFGAFYQEKAQNKMVFFRSFGYAEPLR